MILRRVVLFAIAFVIPLAGALPAPAGPLVGWSSDNVEFIANVPLPTAASAYRVGDYLYVLHQNGIDTFDTSDPSAPRRVSSLMTGAHTFSFENPDGSRTILLTAEAPSSSPRADDAGMLTVVDIRDREHPSVLSQLPGGGDHTWTCLLDCRWAYGGSTGKIIDLRDPSRPRLTEGNWAAGLRFHSPSTDTCPPLCVPAHDVTEVSPGLILTATTPMYLLDARKDPLNPRVIARSDGSPFSRGGVVWPSGARSPMILSFQEPTPAYPPNCRVRALLGGTSLESGFKVWNARGWRQTRLFRGLDEYFAVDGTFVDGNPPAATSGYGSCIASWFDPHRNFDAGGWVVLAYGGYGTKFLDVSRAGHITEIGYWLPPPPSSVISSYWITDEIVYSIDLNRGIDILRFTEASS